MAYLSFCSLALLLRHIPRHRESISSIPIMATPSFMPNQMESNVSTVHLLQRGRLVSDARSPVEHFHHEWPFGKKRWYLTVSVNGDSTAVEGLGTGSAFPMGGPGSSDHGNRDAVGYLPIS